MTASATSTPSASPPALKARSADAAAGLFGTGQTTIQTTQDLQLISGLPPWIALSRIMPVYITGSFVVENGGAYAKSR